MKISILYLENLKELLKNYLELRSKFQVLGILKLKQLN